MLRPTEYSFTRYLAAKKSIDDRALNHHVWQSLMCATTARNALQVLEVGAGIGTMLERLLAGGGLTEATYTAIDIYPNNIDEAHRRLCRYAINSGFSVREEAHGRLVFHRQSQRIVVVLEAIDLFDFIAREQDRQVCDLLIAHAFLDLVDLPTTVPLLFSLLRTGGLYYFPLNFDGVTILQPQIEPVLDEQIIGLYHQTMHQRIIDNKVSGDSYTGRHLFSHLQSAGTQVLAAGSSDWVVYPASNGYLADEAYFLHFIIHTLHGALQGHPQLDAQRFQVWIDQRHVQIEQNKLIYIAHQLDFLGRVPAAE